MASAGACSRFLLIIFLQLLRSTTTSPTPGHPKLPLIVFQQHTTPHHHHGGPHVITPPDHVTTPPSQDDYYAYNVAVGGADEDDVTNDDVILRGGIRKHHYGGSSSKQDDNDGSDDGDDIFVAPPTRGKKHHFGGGANSAEFSKGMRTLYQVGDSESSLPECGAWGVCGKVDVYEPSRPWLEKQCRCPANAKGVRRTCSDQLSPQDGHTIVDKTRHYKVCEPVRRLPKCRYFRDVTWTLRSTAENGTQQTMHCLCPKGAVAYLIKRQAYQTSTQAIGYQYSFACSPQSRLRCQRKEPCRLFTVRKRQELLDEVNTNTLCQCPHAHVCPTHHTQSPGVVQGKTYLEENVRTYSGYCLPPHT